MKDTILTILMDQKISAESKLSFTHKFFYRQAKFISPKSDETFKESVTREDKDDRYDIEIYL